MPDGTVGTGAGAPEDAPGTADRPRLRMLEAFPVDVDGERRLALRDPAGFTADVAVLPLPLLDLVSLFDGERSLRDIQAVLARRHGAAPSVEQIRAIAAQLDAAGFLDSAGFRARRAAIEAAFLARPTRPAAHVGRAYPAEAEALRAQVDAWLAALPPEAPDGHAPLRGLIAPHIDFHRGGPTYAWAYRALARTDADLFVILGTCHAGMRDPFALTRKAFETPLGPVPVDGTFCDALAARARQDLFASEAAHRIEHSIEFQAVMLRHALGGRPFAIVPVLASFLHEALAAGGPPERDRRVPAFLEALGETLATSGRRACVIAGVDLAHVGPRFGDPEPNTPDRLARVAEADARTLAAVTAVDAAAFYADVAADGDARRICGLSPIYALLRVLGGGSGRLLRYTQWPDPQGAVTFAAAAFA